MPDAGLPAEAGPSDPAGLVAVIRSGVPFAALLGGPEQDAAVDAAVEALAGEPIAFVRICGPPRTTLSRDQLVFQLTRGSAPGREEGQAEHVARALLGHSAGKKQLVILVAQAETLSLPALSLLQGLPALRREGAPPVQVVFTGAPGFRMLLADDRLHVLQDALDPPSAPPGRPARVARSVKQGRTRAPLVVAVAGAILAIAAVLAVVVPGRRHDSTPIASVDAPSPAVPEPPPPPAAPPASATLPAATLPATTLPAEAPPPATADAAAPPSPSPLPDVATREPPPVSPPAPESPEEARTRLFREFTAFLEARGMTGRLSRPEREALFEEYLARHRVAPAVSRAAPASPAPDLPQIAAQLHVVLLVPPGSGPGQALAEREAELLRGKATDIATRAAPTTVSAPTIRYFFPDDRAPALSLARELPVPGGEWRLEDMTSQPGRPDPGTIEIWLPG